MKTLGRLPLVVVGVIFAMTPRLLVGCTCEQPSLANAVSGHDLVFYGQATAGRVISKKQGPHIAVTFEVLEAVKGGDIGAAEFVTNTSAVCGVGITIGAHYLVIANKDRVLWMCSGTRVLNGPCDEEVMQQVRDVLSHSGTQGNPPR